MRRARDSWLRSVESDQPVGNTTGTHVLSGGVWLDQCVRLAFKHVHFRNPQYGGGGGNGDMFRLGNTQETLLYQCSAAFSRHGFVFSGMRASGNVLLQCVDSETARQRANGDPGNQTTNGSGSDHHMHFSHSNLIDSCIAYNSYFTAHYRPFGSTPQHNITAAHSTFRRTEGTGSRGGEVVPFDLGSGPYNKTFDLGSGPDIKKT